MSTEFWPKMTLKASTERNKIPFYFIMRVVHIWVADFYLKIALSWELNCLADFLGHEVRIKPTPCNQQVLQRVV